MSDSDRGKFSKTGLIAGSVIALLIGAAIVGWGWSETAQYQRKADYEASEHSKYTSDKVAETCVGISTAEKIACLGDAINAQRAYEREEQDLVAQRENATWAYVMAFAAVIGVALSVVGVFLVWTTFRETKEANLIAREMGEAQVRCYLRGFEAHLVYLGEKWIAACKVKNYGQSPALSVCWNARLNLYAKGDGCDTTGVPDVADKITVTRFDISAGDDTLLGPLTIHLPLSREQTAVLAQGACLDIHLQAGIIGLDIFGKPQLIEESFVAVIHSVPQGGQKIGLTRFAKVTTHDPSEIVA